MRELARDEARAESGAKVSGTAAEVLANIDAMELAIGECAAAPDFDSAQILAIHRTLMTPAPNAHVAGKIRTTQNWIGGNDYNPCGADFVPPPPEHVPALLDDLCSVVNDDSMPPVLQAALVHAHFETIHPFDDGNGRTGRALIHVVLRRRRIPERFVAPISVVFAGGRNRYIAGLTAYRHGEVSPWIEQFATAVARAAELTVRYIDEVAALEEQWRTRLRAGPSPRGDAAAWAVIDVLAANPIITAPVAVAATGRAKAAVHAAPGQLAAAGVLVPLAGGRRNRAWEAAGLLGLVAAMEQGGPRGSSGA